MIPSLMIFYVLWWLRKFLPLDTDIVWNLLVLNQQNCDLFTSFVGSAFDWKCWSTFSWTWYPLATIFSVLSLMTFVAPCNKHCADLVCFHLFCVIMPIISYIFSFYFMYSCWSLFMFCVFQCVHAPTLSTASILLHEHNYPPHRIMGYSNTRFQR